MTEALGSLVGATNVVPDPPVILDGVRPRWLVAPASVEELAAVVALAADASLVVCPLGSGSALELGFPLHELDVAVDLRRLDTVLEYNPDDLTVSVQAGVTLSGLNALLLARRQFLPVDPPAGATRTLGGIAATHAHGPLRLKYRSIRDLLLGVRFVQADGVVTWGGARVVKSVTGYDIPKLMVGALGTLGILAELTLRLQPMPDAEATWIAGFSTVEAAAEFVSRVLDSPLQPSRLEFLDAATQQASGLESGRAAVAVSIGSVEDAVRSQGATLSDLARSSGGGATKTTPTFWDDYERATAPAARSLWLKVATLPSGLASVARVVATVASVAGMAVAVSGSAALGLLRVGTAHSDPEAGVRLVEELRAGVAGHGGSVVIEGGPRAVRARVDPWGPVEPGALGVMRGLKDRFDPSGTLNPGRFVGTI